MKAFAKKSMKVTALLLVFALLFMTACTGGNGNGGTQDTVSPQPQQTPAAPANTPAPPVAPTETPTPATPTHGNIHPIRDMGGRTLRLASWWEGTIVGTVGDEPDPATEDNYWIARMVWDNARRVEEQFNVRFTDTMVDYENVLPTLTTSVMAGDPFADVVMLSGWMQLSAILGDLIQPLEGSAPANSDIFGGNVYGRVITEALGHTWSFVDAQPDANGVTLGINLDIINAIGAPNPVDLYNQGRWTWDAFLDIMRLATADTTGDGIIDQFGVAGQPGDVALHLIGANDGMLVTDDFNYGFDHPNTIEALELVEIIFSEGLWEYDRVSGDPMGDWGRNFFSFQDGNAAFFPAVTWAMNDGNLPFEFAVVPFPLGPANTSGNTWLAGWNQGFTVPVGTSWDIEDIIIIIEELFSWPGDEPELLVLGALGWPRAVFLTEEDVQRQVGVSLTQATDIGMNVAEYSWILGTFIEHFMNQVMTAAQAVETYRGPQQEMLDMAFRS
jgi:multiple sugar transport system substrate-binding protein